MQLPPGTTFDVAAVLFDMDGTLVDSTAAVVRIWHRWAARHGIDPDAILRVSHGRRAQEVMREFAPASLDIAVELDRLEEMERAETEGVIAVPGAAALLGSLPRERWAVVTSATRRLAEVRLALTGLPMPAAFVGAADVAEGKPNPEGYRLAAARLGVDPAACLVLEDAPAGLAAGRAAGARVVALATTLPSAELEHWDWLADLRPLQHVPSAGPGLRLRIR